MRVRAKNKNTGEIKEFTLSDKQFLQISLESVFLFPDIESIEEYDSMDNKHGVIATYKNQEKVIVLENDYVDIFPNSISKDEFDSKYEVLELKKVEVVLKSGKTITGKFDCITNSIENIYLTLSNFGKTEYVIDQSNIDYIHYINNN